MKGNSLNRLMGLLLGTMFVSSLLTVYLGLTVIEQVKISGPLFQRMVLVKDLLADILPPPAFQLEAFSIGLQLLDSESPQEKSDLKAQFEELTKEAGHRHDFWVSKLVSKESLLLEGKVYSSGQTVLGGIKDKIIPLVDGGKTAEARKLFRQEILPAYNAHREMVDSLVKRGNSESDLIEVEAAQTEASGKHFFIGGALLLLFMIFGIGMKISWILKGTFSEIAKQLLSSATQVAQASQEIAKSGEQIARGATEQASSVQESNANLTQLSSSTKLSSDHSKQADLMAENTRQNADEGQKSMGRLVEAIQDINKSAEETAKILKDIDGIAFQTNLLALNAAVEAARAGDSGRGFAVVAEEVRSLAIRSAEAAKNTAALIGESLKKSAHGSKVSSEVSAIFLKILEATQNLTQTIREVSRANENQFEGIENIHSAVSNLENITQSNAANAEQSAAASEQLSAQAISLQAIVNSLSVMVGNGKGTSQGFALSVSENSTVVPARGMSLRTQMTAS